jgi:transposase
MRADDFDARVRVEQVRRDPRADSPPRRVTMPVFARIAFDQKIETWLRCHVEAFAALGAVPRTLVPDNLKSAVVRAAFGVDEPASLNRSYRELARHYHFKIDPTPIGAPKKKGGSSRASVTRSKLICR